MAGRLGSTQRRKDAPAGPGAGEVNNSSREIRELNLKGISIMNGRRIVSLVFGGAATLATMVAALGLLVFGGLYQGGERLIIVSIALAPVVLVSAMVGYGVWWAVLFLLSLFLPDPGQEDPR